MPNIGRRRFLKKTTMLAGVPIIAGFPSVFSVAHAKDNPPGPSDKSKKTVSQSKPSTDKKTKK
jgi:hypothetical protein